MTPTQWLAIPTEISLADFPKLISSSAEGVDMQTVIIDGKSYVPVIKQEKDDEDLEVKDEPASNRDQTGVYLYSMGNGLLATSENVARALSIECTPDTSTTGKCPASPVSSTTPDIVILKSKPKNPDYKVKHNTLATKRSRPVSMKLVRARPGLRIKIWMNYQSHVYVDEPVKRCKKHDECVWCGDHQYNQGFCVISKFHHFEKNERGQPLAILTPTPEHLDKDGGAPFSIIFSCWNSCDVHSRFGKVLQFSMEILDEGNNVVRLMELSLHCCQNLLRDAFKDRKRKQHSETENGEEESMAKSACIGDMQTMASPSPPPHSTIPGNKGEKSFDVVVEGLDEEKRDLIERMVKVMGGATYRIPHLNRIRPACNEVKCDAATSSTESSDTIPGDLPEDRKELKSNVVYMSVADLSKNKKSKVPFTNVPDHTEQPDGLGIAKNNHISEPVPSTATPSLTSDLVTTQTTANSLFVGHNGSKYKANTSSVITKHTNTLMHSIPATLAEPLPTAKLKSHLTAKAMPLINSGTHRIVFHTGPSQNLPTTITPPKVTTKAYTSLLATTTSSNKTPVKLDSIRAVSPSLAKSKIISTASDKASKMYEPQTIRVKIENPWP